MNSCFAILLVMGANPYQPVVVSAQAAAQDGASNQSVLISESADTATQQAQPQQPRPIQVVQGTLLPPFPGAEPIPTTHMPYQNTDSRQTVQVSACSGGSCGGGSCQSSGGGDGCLMDLFRSNKLNPYDLSDDCDECEVCDEDKFHCWDSTYDMPQHFPYPPVYHGYYYYRPYNYAHVLKHKQQLLGDSAIAPYTSMVFEQLYAEFPNKKFNPAPEAINDDPRIPPTPKALPNLQDLVGGGSDG